MSIPSSGLSSAGSSVLAVNQLPVKTVCFYSHRRLQSTVHYCNTFIFILASLLGIIASISYNTYNVHIDSDLIVRRGYTLTSIVACLATILGSGAELKSSHIGLVLSSSIQLFVLILVSLALTVGVIDFNQLYFSIQSQLEQSFLNASEHFLVSMIATINTNETTTSTVNLSRPILTQIVARTMKLHSCCGWYSPREICNSTSCPGACCPATPFGHLSQIWLANCTHTNRFQDVCYDKMIEQFRTDLSIMNTIAALLIPLCFSSTVCSFKLAQYSHDYD